MLSAIRLASLAMVEQQFRYPNNYSRRKSRNLKGVNKGLFVCLFYHGVLRNKNPGMTKRDVAEMVRV